MYEKHVLQHKMQLIKPIINISKPLLMILRKELILILQNH